MIKKHTKNFYLILNSIGLLALTSLSLVSAVFVQAQEVFEFAPGGEFLETTQGSVITRGSVIEPEPRPLPPEAEQGSIDNELPTMIENPAYPDLPPESYEISLAQQGGYQPFEVYLQVRDYVSDDGQNWQRQGDSSWQKVDCESIDILGVNDNWDTLSIQSYIRAMERNKELMAQEYDPFYGPGEYVLASARRTGRLCSIMKERSTGSYYNIQGCGDREASLYPRSFEDIYAFTTISSMNECHGYSVENYETINPADNIPYLSVDRYTYIFPEDQKRELSQQYESVFGDGLAHRGIEMIYPQFTHRKIEQGECVEVDGSEFLDCDLVLNPELDDWVNPAAGNGRWQTPAAVNLWQGWLVYPLKANRGEIFIQPLTGDIDVDGNMKWHIENQTMYKIEDQSIPVVYVYSPGGDEYQIPVSDINIEKKVLAQADPYDIVETVYSYDGPDLQFAIGDRQEEDLSSKSYGDITFKEFGTKIDINYPYDQFSQEYGYILDGQLR
jgi:hypothetical protein